MYPELYKSLLHNLCDGVFFIDASQSVTYWNQGAEAITGLKANLVKGETCSKVMNHRDENNVSLCEDCPALKTMADGERREYMTYITHPDGSRVQVLMCISPIIAPDGTIEGAVEIFSDISWKQAALDRIGELQRLSLLDPLTGIGNRRHGELCITTRISEMKRYGFTFGLLFADIDHFKEINDTYGHDVGDTVIKEVSKALASSLRPFDTIIRWGGEEFVIVLINPGGIQQVEQVAERVRSIVEQQLIAVSSAIRLHATVSIGATIALPNDTPQSIIDRADMLNYKSKGMGRNCISAG